MDKADWISKQARKLHSFAVGHSDDSMCRCGRTRWNAVMYKQPRWSNLDMYTNTYTEIGVETCAAVKQNNVGVKSEGWLGVDNCNVQVSCGRDRSMLLPASPRNATQNVFAKTFRRIHLSPIPFSPKAPDVTFNFITSSYFDTPGLVDSRY
jgi:hypothetical protein